MQQTDPPLPVADVFNADCPSRMILSHVSSRWGGLVLVALRDGRLRFSELRRRIGGISERMLAQTLQVLEADGLISRRDHGEVPPRVDYCLTEAGEAIAIRYFELAHWIEANLSRLGTQPAQSGD